LIFEGNKLDNAGMLYDFGLMKSTIKEFIDSMDHCYILCAKDNEDFKNFIKGSCDRWIELPFNPSAECLAMFIQYWVNHIIGYTRTRNGEGQFKCVGVKYHETATGYAESSLEDLENIWEYEWGEYTSYKFSDGVIKDWSKDLVDVLISNLIIENPIVKQQIEL
jgi:6-pyruvoyltetrahydropterin/6-carboxytetrahydropterin synthase